MATTEGAGLMGTGVLLLATVAVATVLGRLAGGVLAAVVATAGFAYLALPPHGSFAVLVGEIPQVVAFAAAAAAVTGIFERLRRVDRARAAAEDASAQLADQVRLLAPVVDHSPLGVAVVDTEGRYRYVNKRLAAIKKRAPAEHVGHTLSELLAPEMAAILEPPLREVLATGTAAPDSDVTLTFDGEQRHFLVNRYPLRGADDELLGAAVTVQDVTERRTLQALEAESAQLRATAELIRQLEASQRIAGFGSWEIDLGTDRVTWSPQMQAILGTADPPSDVTQALAFLTPGRARTLGELVDHLLHNAWPLTTEGRLVRPDGKPITVVTTAEPVFDEQGRLVRIWGATIDVTARRAAEEAAQQARQRAEAARVRLRAEHHALQMFQNAMLPAAIPTVPGVDLAVAYHPVADRMDIGGDWYDAFVLPDRRLAVALGDVAGHDVRAAAIMGQVRNAVRAYALEDPCPSSVLRRVNTLLATLPELDLVTMLVGLYDPKNHTLTWSRAGHPPPVACLGDEPLVLDEPEGVILGVMKHNAGYPERTITLRPGCTVLWYTDGLIEHAGLNGVGDLDKLAHTLADLSDAGSAQEIVTNIAEAMVPPGAQNDDVCLLALRRPVTGARRPRT
ncbi:MAG TPA: SpoIIE family protein phosphatase [Micromonosporaceae bacterium]